MTSTGSVSGTQFCRAQLLSPWPPALRPALALAPRRMSSMPSRRKARALAWAGPSENGSQPNASTAREDAETRYLSKRAGQVTRHFPSAIGVDDFMTRVESALYPYGFKNGNSIAMVNLCRDEITHTLKHRIDQVFGSSFSVHGLGGLLSCGLVGMGAGLSHSPVDAISGKERYVFFSFPHIGVDANGIVGNLARPGRSMTSCACGALIKSLSDIKRHGLTQNCKPPGVHDPIDIELSILKQRLARRLEFEGQTDASVGALDLVELTKVAERTITSDLEFLIAKVVDTSNADYAVVTGVQIHNFGQDFDSREPNLEFVAPVNVYVVKDGKRTELDIARMPALTPRQIRLLASAPDVHNAFSPIQAADAVCNTSGHSTVREIEPPYMYKSRQARLRERQKMQMFAQLATGAAKPVLPLVPASPKPAAVKAVDPPAPAAVTKKAASAPPPAAKAVAHPAPPSTQEAGQPTQAAAQEPGPQPAAQPPAAEPAAAPSPTPAKATPPAPAAEKEAAAPATSAAAEPADANYWVAADKAMQDEWEKVTNVQ